jgi:hypothetical protein
LAAEEVEILSVPNITAQQIIESTLAIPAFVPATVCTGYITAWFTNLHNFRQRSLIERIFWSLPLSFAVTTIAAFLIGRFISLTAVVVFLLASAAVCLATLGWEGRQIHRSNGKWRLGWNPLGGKTLLLAILWMIVVVSSLVDIQRSDKLFMSITILDHGARVNWTESVLRTGIPPANSLYLYKHPTAMRNYYFWYILCAATAKMTHLSAQAILIASSVWAGFVLAALIGVYLKHFLAAGPDLRRQFLDSVLLLTVTGLGVCAVCWDFFYLHQPPLFDAKFWSREPMTSWLDVLLYAPHHVVALVCCMFAFLLAWMAGNKGENKRTESIVAIALALSSAFGLSVYVTFAFFLVVVAWAVWQTTIERRPLPVFLLAAGGAGACILLFPFLSELTHTTSKLYGGSAFSFAIRDMIPADCLLASNFLRNFTSHHPLASLLSARLSLLAPGYMIELGFYLVVLLIYLVPILRGRASLTYAERSLVFITSATILLISFMRSSVLQSDDFGLRAPLFAQFALLLLATKLISGWKSTDRQQVASAKYASFPQKVPYWLRSIASFALVIGMIGTLYEALLLRFYTSLAGANRHADHSHSTYDPFHNAYISSIGYAELDAAVPKDAVVQFNPTFTNHLVTDLDLREVNHQIAITSDQPWCGSELGGDPSGCPSMAAAIDALYSGNTAEQARITCRQYGIQYLVARVYDPAWKNKNGWVWALRPVVADDEFRALDCRQ